MASSKKTSAQIGNHLLAALPAQSYERLAHLLERVEFTLGEVLHRPQEPIEYVYFPHKSTISLVNILQDGSMVEVGVVGSEGMAGVSLLSGDNISPHQAIVQIRDGAMRMRAGAFQNAIKEDAALTNILLRYQQALFTQVAQTAACNRLHPVEERLARWLLLSQDRMETSELGLTQEFIATMLGVRRATVTVAALSLQAAGIITYNHGKISILNREGLEEASCECYSIVKKEFERLLAYF